VRCFVRCFPRPEVELGGGGERDLMTMNFCCSTREEADGERERRVECQPYRSSRFRFRAL
jgi:hypothetical protein